MTAFWRFIETVAACMANGSVTDGYAQELSGRIEAIKAASIDKEESYLCINVLGALGEDVLDEDLVPYVADVEDYMYNEVGFTL